MFPRSYLLVGFTHQQIRGDQILPVARSIEYGLDIFLNQFYSHSSIDWGLNSNVTIVLLNLNGISFPVSSLTSIAISCSSCADRGKLIGLVYLKQFGPRNLDEFESSTTRNSLEWDFQRVMALLYCSKRMKNGIQQISPSKIQLNTHLSLNW